MAIFDKKDLDSLGSEPYANAVILANKVIYDVQHGIAYPLCVAQYEFFTLWLQEQNLPLKVQRPELVRDEGQNRGKILQYLQTCFGQLTPEAHARAVAEQTELALAEGRKQFAQLSNTTFAYRFSDSDFNTLQDSINRLRELVITCKALTDDQRQRILLRVDAVQRELDRRTTTLDRIWALLIETGFVTTKVGAAAKEISKITGDIARIVTVVAATAHGLPSLLPPPIDFKPPELPPTPQTPPDTTKV